MNLKKGDSLPLQTQFKLDSGLVGGQNLQAKVVGESNGRAHLWVTKHGIRVMELDAVSDGKETKLEDHK